MAGFLGDLISGIFGNEAADKSADAKVNATKDSNKTLLQMYNTSNQITEPNRIAGLNALSMQGSLLGNPNMVDPASVNRSLQATSGAPGSSTPDWNGYLQANPDVASSAQKMVSNGSFANPQAYAEWHYNKYGRSEGRQGSNPVGMGAAGTANGSPVQTGISTGDAYGMFNDSGFAKSMLETTNADMGRMVGQFGAAGNALSGSAIGALNDRNRANTSNAFGNYYNALSGISGTGANISQQAGQNALTTGTNVANNQQQIGQIRGSSYATQGQNNANMINSGINAAAMFFGGQ